MPEKQFIVTETVKFDYSMYRIFRIPGSTYNEEHLREWANDRWGTPLDASLEVIARDIKQGGWMMFEYVVPAESDEEFENRPRLGNSTLVRRD